MIMETEADYECVEVYKVYTIGWTHLIEEFGPAERIPQGNDN